MDTLVGLAELNEADASSEAGRALNKVSWNENTMAADDQGNIGWYCTPAGCRSGPSAGTSACRCPAPAARSGAASCSPRSART